MSDFEMVKSFDIDSGELDGIAPNECFVLGYELALVDEQLKNSSLPISRPVHAHNRERIAKSCESSRRQFKLIWPHDDSSEEWMQLVVAPLE